MNLRRWLQIAGMTIAALLLLGPLTAQTQQPIKIGVVAGVGGA